MDSKAGTKQQPTTADSWIQAEIAFKKQDRIAWGRRRPVQGFARSLGCCGGLPLAESKITEKLPETREQPESDG